MAVVALCVVIFILLFNSYVSRTRSFYIFISIVSLLIIASFVNIAYHALLDNYTPGVYTHVYVLRILYYGLLLNVLFQFALYITIVTNMEHSKAREVAILATGLLIAVVAIDIIMTLTNVGYRIDHQTGEVIRQNNVFLIGYVLFVLLLVALMARAQNLLYKKVLHGFFGVMAVSIIVRFTQVITHKATLTTMTFVFPVIAMLYFLHSNPYNITLGTVDRRAMGEMVKNMSRRGKTFIFLSLFMPEYDVEGKEFPEELKTVVREFSVNYFKRCVLFRVSNGQIVMMTPKSRVRNLEQRIDKILEDFDAEYQRFNIPYKIVIGESVDEINQKNEYSSLIRHIQDRMPDNSVHRLVPEDIELFNRDEYILQQLRDIYYRHDLDDPRVLTYCQPVFDLQTGQFDTAEALMRLDLEETGLVPPDQFIPMAENNGYIHVLTEIILNKTCAEIRRLTEEGYLLKRVSVNVSVLEIKEDSFCGDIEQIVLSNGILGEKIALEMTESHTEADFVIMKEKIEELHKQGIQFYLDDFGTGYSNMQKILELPFDIIKYDRALVAASGAVERSRIIVENLAQMFTDMDCTILYEGVETDDDEDRCRKMFASYLQGFKYSRPIPIGQLREFLSKEES